ncbi:MAG: ROK family protein [Candidatus Levybacteria bacterium]|nr:ROK family protein [Candidatus Levybacteria bacterium]
MYLLFDIGATKMRFALANDDMTIGEMRIVQTPQNFSQGLSVLQNTVEDMKKTKKITSIAGGIAGPLDIGKTMLINAPNMPDWAGKPLKHSLETAFDTPRVFLENDAALVGLGEATAGSGKEHRIVAYITVSTGLGGARIVNGHVDANAFGFEPGHQIVQADGITCLGCGGKGHLEGYVGGRAIEAQYGKKPYEIKEPAVWDTVSRWLAVGLANVSVLWSPNCIVLGGSVMESISLDILRSYLAQTLTIFPTPPQMVRATLGEQGGLQGALALIKQNEPNTKLVLDR